MEKEFDFEKVSDMIYSLDCPAFWDYLKTVKENAAAEWKAYEDAHEKAMVAEDTEPDDNILNELYGEVDAHSERANAWEEIADEMEALLEKVRDVGGMISGYGFAKESPLYCGIPNRYFGKW